MAAMPTLLAYPTGDGRLKVWCRYCKLWHYHGFNTGHRAAHCTNKASPYLKTGYIMRRVETQ